MLFDQAHTIHIGKRRIFAMLLGIIVIGSVFLFVWTPALHIKGNEASAKFADQSLTVVLEACAKSVAGGFDFSCFRVRMPALMRQYGTREIMGALAELDESNEGKGLDCHGISHIVGEVSAKMNTQGLGETLVQCTRDCGFGCFHGAAFGALSQNPRLLDNLASVCDVFSRSSFPGQELTACQHSLGHGLVELASRDPRKSLLLCDRLGDEGAKGACGTGVLMELIEGPVLDHGVTLLKLPKDIPAFCKTLPDKYAQTCLINVGSYEYKRSGDAKRSFELCQSLPAAFALNCAGDLGTDFHFIFAGDARTITHACAAGDAQQEGFCLKGAIISGLVTDPAGSLGIALCQDSPQEFQAACFGNLGRSMEHVHGPNKRSSFCEKLNQREERWCLGIS